jgi:hypothetical protein
MEKKCFVMMPTSEPAGYSAGHFNRVYDYIVVPACRMAGFWPERADNPNTSNTASDVMKDIVDSDIAICDLSAGNPNAHYGISIRQALGLPLTLIKDTKTQTAFSLHELNQLEYDESLRIDTVQKEVEALSEALKKTFASKSDTNSWLTRLGIGPGQQVEIQPAIVETKPEFEPLVLDEIVEKKSPLPIISPLPDYVGESLTELDIDKLKVGDTLFHMNHGRGEIHTIKKMGKDKIAELLFESGSKTLVIGTSGFFRNVIA